MNMYILKPKKYPDRKLMVVYEESGFMSQIQFDGPWDDEQRIWVLNHMPLREAALEFHMEKHFVITAAEPDLDFDTFWNKYAYKVGNKKRSEKLWAGLSDIDKATCMRSVKIYDHYLVNHPKMEKCYPETYLAQRRFESQYK